MSPRLKLSPDGKFLDQASLSRLSSHRREFVALPHRDAFGVVKARKFYPCVIGGVEYHADVVTGSLYEVATGRCATSEQMRVVTEAPAKAAKPARRPRQGTAWQRTEKAAA